MGRPRKDNSQTPVEQRIEEAFWQLIQQCPIERITVSALTKQARCNRGTFYYYFNDVYDLLDKVVKESVPAKLPSALVACVLKVAETGENTQAVESAYERMFETAGLSQVGLDRLCVLLNCDVAPLVMKRVKAVAMKLWADILGLKEDQMTGQIRIALEFSMSGLMGILAYRAESGLRVRAEDIVIALAPEIPQALLACVARAAASEKAHYQL